ncbi:MAG TPA: HAMP domain-containing sensor histidine kinase, partial [Candidatus Polarisedimenticolia bacterium]|nr:HAMP domain-containing sensor histidine kinase [Candidatus Polarisedimenticolia bacterium]
YLAGVATTAAGLLVRAQGRVRALRLDLRAAQDHLMEHGSSRSLPAWLAETAEPLREAAASLSRESRSLVAEVGLPEPVRAAAGRIAAGVETIQRVTAPMQSMSLLTPSRAPFNVNTLLREAIDLCRHRAEEKRIRFEERLAVLPPVFGPSERVQAAFLNLVVNAVEAMPFGGGSIAIETAHEADRVIVRLRDSGIGIRPEHLAKAAEPFFTTKPERGAAGLGLWEARQIIDAIGGALAITSVPHQGTEVVVTLPEAAPLSPGRAGVGHSAEELGRNTADTGDLRIA